MLVLTLRMVISDFSFFDVFQYLTLRGILAVLTALGLCLAMGPLMIRRLTELKIGQSIRDDGPQTHLLKRARQPWVARWSCYQSVFQRCFGGI